MNLQVAKFKYLETADGHEDDAGDQADVGNDQHVEVAEYSRQFKQQKMMSYSGTKSTMAPCPADFLKPAMIVAIRPITKVTPNETDITLPISVSRGIDNKRLIAPKASGFSANRPTTTIAAIVPPPTIFIRMISSATKVGRSRESFLPASSDRVASFRLHGQAPY